MIEKFSQTLNKCMKKIVSYENYAYLSCHRLLFDSVIQLASQKKICTLLVKCLLNILLLFFFQGGQIIIFTKNTHNVLK